VTEAPHPEATSLVAVAGLSGADDLAFMALALRLARRALGSAWPNPAVGCVLVREGVIVGRGWTQPGGRPHAEAVALARAGMAAAGATAYVSLEPCAHFGVTPPCADALIGAGIARVVVAVEDPDPRVCGQGGRRLRAAGVEVTTGVLAADAARLNRGFFCKVKANRPLFTLKAATSLDGRIATRTGDSRWITGEAARRAGHGLRASHDGILVGINTVIADDPALDCRLPGMAARSPVSIVADSTLRLPAAAQVVERAHERPCWVMLTARAALDRRRLLEEKGVRLIEVESGRDGRPAPKAMAAALAGLGLTRVLIEGGGTIAAAFVAAGLIDQVAWFHAPVLIGGDGRASLSPFGIERLADAPRLLPRGTWAVGSDHLGCFDRTEDEEQACLPGL
jgi:diaminohydroxyphosphoribosylaminopyrimidine deaminase/5-amino-6-(5-phosphoribosylamino)uracil reductase